MLAPQREIKQCKKCKIEFVANLDNFYRHNRSKDGLTAYCKACSNLMLQAARAKKNRTHRKLKVVKSENLPLPDSPEALEITKICTKCNKDLSLNNFRFRPKYKRYQSHCHECESRYFREHYKLPGETKAGVFPLHPTKVIKPDQTITDEVNAFIEKLNSRAEELQEEESQLWQELERNQTNQKELQRILATVKPFQKPANKPV